MRVRRVLVAAAVAGLGLGATAGGGQAAGAGGGTTVGAGDAKAQQEAAEAGDRLYDRAVKHAKARRWDKALELFEKALPYKNGSSDIFYNLVTSAEQLKDWEKVHLYATGFLFHEPEGDDAKEFERKRRAAEKHLERAKRSPVSVSFDLAADGATVMVDHVPVARSRGAGVSLVPRRYTATASKEDHHPWSQVVEVTQATPQIVRGELKRMIFNGFLKITTTPAEGVQVFQDDQLIGTTPLAEPLRLETRKYLFRFEKPGFDSWVRYVEIKRDETAELTPALERTSAP